MVDMLARDILGEGSPRSSGKPGRRARRREQRACLHTGEDEQVSDIEHSSDEEWERLPPLEIGRRLMSLPARRRLEIILSRPDPEQVVSRMAEQDFFLTVKEIGREDSLPLLALGTMDQLGHLFDIEWWRKDTVVIGSALEWLDLLRRAGEGRLLAWLYQVDFELLTLLFKRWIQVVMIPEDVDLVEARGDLPPHTIDDQFFWECSYPQYESLAHHVLGLLFEAHQGFYLELMNHILWLPDAECEEAAYRFHRGRLEDLGVPDFYDSLAIYRSPRPQELGRGRFAAEPPVEGAAPSFALTVTGEGDLFRRCLAEIDDRRLLDTLGMELASLANKVLVADEMPPDDPRALPRAAEKAAAYVNLGLTERSQDSPTAAQALLREIYLEDLFRLGSGMVSRVQRRVVGLIEGGWISGWPHRIQCLDPEWHEWVERILQRTPQLRREGERFVVGGREDVFRTPRDVAEAERRIDVLVVMGRLLNSLLDQEGPPDWDLWSESLISRMENVTLGSMLWTAASRAILEGEWRLAPLPASQWAAAWPALHPADFEGVIGNWVVSVLREPDQIELTQTYLGPIHDEYARQRRSILEAGSAVPDPRLMGFFLFTDG